MAVDLRDEVAKSGAVVGTEDSREGLDLFRNGQQGLLFLSEIFIERLRIKLKRFAIIKLNHKSA